MGNRHGIGQDTALAKGLTLGKIRHRAKPGFAPDWDMEELQVAEAPGRPHIGMVSL